MPSNGIFRDDPLGSRPIFRKVIPFQFFPKCLRRKVVPFRFLAGRKRPRVRHAPDGKSPPSSNSFLMRCTCRTLRPRSSATTCVLLALSNALATDLRTS